MKLQHKLAVYNTLTKIAIIVVMGVLIAVFINRISINHLKERLIDKRDKLISGLSEEEIDDLLQKQDLQKEASFTDYNILKEEYIILTEIDPTTAVEKPHFTTDKKEIDGEVQEYEIIEDQFNYYGRSFRLEIGETMSAVKQLENTILYFTFFVLIISVSITLFVDLAFTRVLLSPFYKIIDQKINKVNDPAHYNYAPAVTTTDDFKLLDYSIGSLMRKISDLFLAEKQFISNISHELLTPISVLRSRLENMLNDEGLSGESQVKIAASLKTLIRLKSVVNSLLLISKVENNQFLRNDSIPLTALIREVVEELEDRLKTRNISLTVDLNSNYTLNGNQPLIHILFTNLVNNAIKYNQDNGLIRITDEKDAKGYRVIIRDTGIGMDERQIDLAFNRFEKLPESDNDSHGLGLAIVKSIATFHEISIMLTSEKGIGTSVIIHFN